MKYKHFLPQIITSLILAACASATPVTEIPPTETGTDSIGTINRVIDLVQHNQDWVSTPEDLFQNDSLRVLDGGEGLLDFGSDMRMRMFNDTELGGVRTTNDPGTPLIVKMTLFSGGFTGQMFREGGEAEFDTPNGARIRVFGTTFVVVYDRDNQMTLCGNFEGDMTVEASGSELISIPAGIIYAVRPGEEPVEWSEIPWTPTEYEVLARVDQSPLTPFLGTPLTGEEPTTTPTNTLTPSPSPTITFTPTPTSMQTSTPTPSPDPSDYDIAFSSDKDEEFAIYLMDSNNPSRWMKLERPREYERIMWPSFCGSRIAAEAKDTDNEKRQWIYLLSPEGYIEEWNPPGSPDQLGVPRCSANGDLISYSAFEKGNWVLNVADTSGVNRLMTDNTGLGISGYASWYANNQDLLWMAQDGDIWIILKTDGFQISNTEQLLPRETTSGDIIEEWRHPAISPDGTQYAFNCLVGGTSYICVADIYSNRARTLRKIVREDVGVWVSVNPVWSRDGKWIYFNSAEDGDWDIYRMSPDGTDLENLTLNWDSTEFHPATRW